MRKRGMVENSGENEIGAIALVTYSALVTYRALFW